MQLSGPIVPVGGGGMHPEIIETIKQMIGKPSYSVLILPQAGGTEDRGVAGVAMWEEAGAGRRAHMQCSSRVHSSSLGGLQAGLDRLLVAAAS